jgi:hypothetical protein
MLVINKIRVLFLLSNELILNLCENTETVPVHGNIFTQPY